MAKAMLICKMPMPGEVTFDFNPDKMSVTRRSSRSDQGGGRQGAPTTTVTRRVPPAQIKIQKVYLVGDDTKDRADTLLDWMTPGGGLLGAAIGAAVSALTGGRINLASKPPTLTFIWGTAFMLECTLSQCSVNYTRFDSDGTPIRAEVQLTLDEKPSLLSLLAQNPTSGGLPGRESHVVIEGENLPTIARAAYGSPSHWRAVAEANGIDDPFRLRPGSVVYLPNANEVLASATTEPRGRVLAGPPAGE